MNEKVIFKVKGMTCALKEDNLTVTVKGTIDGDSIVVSSIE